MVRTASKHLNIWNIAIIVFVITGIVILFLGNKSSATGLTSTGLNNFKYYTVLSNVMCGLAALVWVFVKNR